MAANSAAKMQMSQVKVVQGRDAQLLVEKVIRSRIYDSTYWKEQCFALDAATICDKAADLKAIGGTFGGSSKPSEFLCLAMKLLQLEPEKEIVMEYLKNEEFKYLTALAAFYFRLTASPKDVYEVLEPLLLDYRKLRKQGEGGDYYLTTIDEFIDDLLREERVCSVILPRLPKRKVLEQSGVLDLRYSFLEDEVVYSEPEAFHGTLEPLPRFPLRTLFRLGCALVLGLTFKSLYMEFRFDIDELLWSPISVVTSANLPPRGDKTSRLAEVINEMGQASAIAQNLKVPVTTFSKLLSNPSHQVYIIKHNPHTPKNQIQLSYLQQKKSQISNDGNSTPGLTATFYPFSKSVNNFSKSDSQAATVRALMTNYGSELPQEIFGPALLQSRKFQHQVLSGSQVVGILKIGRKALYMADEKGRMRLTQALCVLDFYVHETYQRRGFGRQLFNYMLDVQSAKPGNFAFDRPSVKLLNFLEKNYALRQILPQSNNFVIFKQYQLTEKYDMEDAINAQSVYKRTLTVQPSAGIMTPLPQPKVTGLEDPVPLEDPLIETTPSINAETPLQISQYTGSQTLPNQSITSLHAA